MYKGKFALIPARSFYGSENWVISIVNLEKFKINFEEFEGQNTGLGLYCVDKKTNRPSRVKSSNVLKLVVAFDFQKETFFFSPSNKNEIYVFDFMKNPRVILLLFVEDENSLEGKTKCKVDGIPFKKARVLNNLLYTVYQDEKFGAEIDKEMVLASLGVVEIPM